MNGIKASKIINQTYGIPVLLLTAYSEMEFIHEARNAQVLGYLVKPISERDLIPAVEMALGQSQRVHHLLGNIKELEQKIEDQKNIQKAKRIIMESYQVSENEAYKSLRSYCMTHRRSMKEVAEEILQHT
ncbi:ANTAR domain-containing protein, partial [Escherichia coli]